MNSAIKYWKERVERHHAQSIKAEQESSWPQTDAWGPFASYFKDGPHRTGDPVLERLAREVDSDKTVLDVGGGAGRFALPLALLCSRVTVVESSASMVEALRDGAREADIDNVSAVQASWEEAKVEPADLVLCAHVVYGIVEIEPFIRRLESHARQRVLVLAFMVSPQAMFSPFWKAVRGEERIDLPAIPELLNVLWEMDIYPDLEMFEPTGPETAPSGVAALEMLRQMLYVKPDTENDRRLQKATEELTVETPEGLTTRDSRPGRQALLSWSPAREAG